MKTGLVTGTSVVAACIGAACLLAWQVREAPPTTAGPLRTEKIRPPMENEAPMATRTDSSAVSTAMEEERIFPLGAWVRQALASEDPAVRAGVLQRGLRKWVRADAESAARFAESITDDALREQVMRVVAQTWSRRDPEQAIAWTAALPDGVERDVYGGAVCLGLAGVDPARAAQWADALGLRDDGVLENLTAQWAAKDESAALSWVYQRPDGPDRDRLMQRIAFAEAQTDPARAARLVVEQIPFGPEQTEAVITVVYQWVQRDPDGAGAWVANFPPGPVRDRALGELRGALAAQ